MKKQQIKPTRSKITILRQICNFILQHTVSKIARETGAEDKSRTFTPWSHVVSQSYAQLTHSISLNDVCDSLQLHSGPLASIRGATAPSRNGFSNANRERPAEMAEKLFWAVLGHLGEQSPGFVAGRRRGAAFRFKLPIHVVDTTVMEYHAQDPQSIGVAHSATVVIERHIQALVGAIFNSPALTVGLEPPKWREFLGGQVGDEADRFVLASGALAGQLGRLRGEGKADVFGGDVAAFKGSALLSALVLFHRASPGRRWGQRGKNPWEEREAAAGSTRDERRSTAGRIQFRRH